MDWSDYRYGSDSRCHSWWGEVIENSRTVLRYLMEQKPEAACVIGLPRKKGVKDTECYPPESVFGVERS